MSSLSTPISSGATLPCSSVFEIAPASKLSHGSSTLPGTMQIIPKFDSLSSLAISLAQRVPLSMSSAESQGSVNGITAGSHSRNATATSWLAWPDQLKEGLINSCFQMY